MERQAGAGPTPDWGVGHYERTAQVLLPAARVLVGAAAPRAGERVLDVGAGTGSAALLAASAGAHVTAVDPSPRLLDVARASASQQGLDLACCLGDAATLPVPDGSVDCALSNFGIVFAADPPAAVAELARALAAGGRIAFTAWLPGGAVGAFASAAQDLVRAAMGVPPAAPGFPWHDQSVVGELFGRHGMVATVAGRHELIFTAPSARAYLDDARENHPLAVAGFQVLQSQEQADQAAERLLEILDEHNEDAGSFRATSAYVVVLATARSGS